MSRLQVKQLNDLVSEADEIVKVSNPDATIFTLICSKNLIIFRTKKGRWSSSQSWWTETEC